MAAFVPRVVRILVLMVSIIAVTASADTASAQLSAPATVPARCRPAQLTVWQAIPGDGAAGSVFYELEFSNISPRTCTLRGYPGVSAVNASGVQLGRAAGREPRFAPRTVMLRPGATVHALLQLTDVGVFDPAICRPVTAAGLRVFPPNTTVATVIPQALRVCSARRGPTFLHDRVVRSGPGIPGVSL